MHISEKELLILGGGGHAKSVADIALSKYQKIKFYDINAKENENILGFPVVSQTNFSSNNDCIPAVGDNNIRAKLFLDALESSWRLTNLISKYATCSPHSYIDIGTVIAHHAHIGPLAKVGKACIINTGAIIEHDCNINDFTHIAINAALGGGVTIGSFCLIGAGAVIKNGITITDKVIIGAGATVIADILEPGIYVGTPAKRSC